MLLLLVAFFNHSVTDSGDGPELDRGSGTNDPAVENPLCCTHTARRWAFERFQHRIKTARDRVAVCLDARLLQSDIFRNGSSDGGENGSIVAARV